MVTTNTGRMVAIGRYGQLMISDNGGSAWTFGRIEVNGGRGIQGQITDAKLFGTTIVATSVFMTRGGPMGWVGRTMLYFSNSNGNSWTEMAFPHDSVDLGGNFEYEGLVLSGLQVGPGGELLAYGTTNLSANMVVLWSIGGAIYRSPDGVNWTLAKFAYGPIYKISSAGGRAIAVGATTVLDSPDGAGWNGYFLGQANVQDAGQPMAVDEADRIRLYDVIESGGNFTTYGIIHKRAGSIIETPFIERQFTMTSTGPFTTRLWQVNDQPTDPGNFVYAGGSLLGIGRRNGVRVSGNGGVSFTQRHASPRPVGRSFTQSGSNITVVNSSNEVWKSTDNGVLWNKIYDDPELPSISNVKSFFGRLFGFDYAFGDERGMYESPDNGETWIKVWDEAPSQMVQVGSRLVAPGSTAKTVRVSDDEGVTWQDRTFSTTVNVGGSHTTTTPTGRIVMSAIGRSVFNQGVFFVSDDNGDTWEERVVGLAWGEYPTSIFCTADGTLLATSNTFSVFNPRIFRSVDNGDTWTASTVLQSLPGLDPISNQPGGTVITVRLFRQGPSGRILMLGDEDEIVCSDDDGQTWTVLVNQDLQLMGDGPWRDWQIEGLVWAGDRWVGISSRNNDNSQRRYYSMVSGDDGETWREAPIALNLASTGLSDLQVGLDGRIIATGSNGAVYTSEVPEFRSPESDGLQVEEGFSLNVTVERP
ncbi:MAG: exo-alpha-sialidase, partial [Verrucomicrobiae bacterium]|nr:exo-alpha-sialidase [Verrucomicrobiae bacterium]